jgi:hypothetical protein
MTTPVEQSRLAVLIDADNTSARHAGDLLEEIAKYGAASVKRAYGDWTSQRLVGWKEELNRHAIQPMQQFAYTTGKNATDSALIIDAMDLLYAGNLDGFVIVSSDSDFTRLASRIRESGLSVYGFGEKKTPAPFVAACDKFIFVELLRENDAEETPTARKSAKDLKLDAKLVHLLRNAVAAASDDSGWAELGVVGSTVAKRAPEFDPRTWGYAKLSGLVKAIGLFEVAERQVGSGPHKALWVRDKQGAASL